MARPWAQRLSRAPSPSAGCPLARRAASEEGPVHTDLRQSMGPPLEGPPQQEQLRAIAPCLPGSDAPVLPTALQGRAQAMQRAGIQAASLSHTCMPWQDTRAGLLPSRQASCSLAGSPGTCTCTVQQLLQSNKRPPHGNHLRCQIATALHPGWLPAVELRGRAAVRGAGTSAPAWPRPGYAGSTS